MQILKQSVFMLDGAPLLTILEFIKELHQDINENVLVILFSHALQ